MVVKKNAANNRQQFLVARQIVGNMRASCLFTAFYLWGMVDEWRRGRRASIITVYIPGHRTNLFGEKKEKKKTKKITVDRCIAVRWKAKIVSYTFTCESTPFLFWQVSHNKEIKGWRASNGLPTGHGLTWNKTLVNVKKSNLFYLYSVLAGV